MSYLVNVSRQVLRDIEEAVFYKRELGTYQENLAEFASRLDGLIYDNLEESPMIGANLSYRLGVETTIRYQVVDDYILCYDVRQDEKVVFVLRLLPAKSNWMQTILKYL